MWRRPGFRTQATKEGAGSCCANPTPQVRHKMFPKAISVKQAWHIKAKKLIAVSFPAAQAFFLRHLVRETRGSSSKDKRRGDLGKGMNRDLLARPYVSPNLASTRRQILSRWTELKSTKAKRIQKQKTENEKAENLKLLARAHASLSRFGPRRL